MIILLCACHNLIDYFPIKTQMKESVVPLFRASSAPRSPNRSTYHNGLTLRRLVWQASQNNLRLAGRQDGSLWTIASVVSPLRVLCFSSSQMKCQYSVLKMWVQARKLFFYGSVPSETVSACLTANNSDCPRNIPGNDISVSNLTYNLDISLHFSNSSYSYYLQ